MSHDFVSRINREKVKIVSKVSYFSQNVTLSQVSREVRSFTVRALTQTLQDEAPSRNDIPRIGGQGRNTCEHAQSATGITDSDILRKDGRR